MRQRLETYRRKRDFANTPEPHGKIDKGANRRFVVQKHDARRLHYDFRLEMDGVLKSWAVTRGPSLVPGEKRLAVHVEDHPISYADFEGTIPKGEYGGGTVLVWDHGIWTPIGDPHRLYEKGHLEFELSGEKLKGRWHLIRMRTKLGEKRENWLLIKGEDAFARDGNDADILEEQPRSVKTGRDLGEVRSEKPEPPSKVGPSPRKLKRKRPAQNDELAALAGTTPAKMPGFVPPMLATLAAAPPQGARWLHEIKFDGYRLQAHIASGRVTLYSRGGLDWTSKFGDDIAKELLALSAKQLVLDGEMVVESDSGIFDFSALQADLSEGRRDRFVFYAFDILYLDGYCLTEMPLDQRKALLKKLLTDKGTRLRFSDHFDDEGAEVLRHACLLGLEGIVSKLRDGHYVSGRGRDWRKTKCTARQEFVIGGFTPSTAARDAIGSLVLGYFDRRRLIPVGRVGTGFSKTVARQLREKLEPLERAKSPFAVPLSAAETHGVHFVWPDLVTEIEFSTWTADKRLRHAAFRGLREDKRPEEVTGEGLGGSPSGKKRPRSRKEIAVKLTHPDRIYWPDEGVTKQGLADYYTEIWPFIEPYVTKRPLALLRCPEGIAGECFFQKHAWKGLDEHIVLVKDPQDEGGEPLISIDDLDGLIALVQAASLEIHPWGATVGNWEHPDMLTMDLDPGENVAWQRVIEAAREMKQRLEAMGLTAFVKTSGGKGLHVVAPLKPKASWSELKAFTKALAETMAADAPDRYVATISKAKRRGKILIDYLRNQRGMTAVAPYSSRARPGAAVSMPLSWDELTPAIGPAHFTIFNSPSRLEALTKNPWDHFREKAAPLPKIPAKTRTQP